MNDGLRVFLIIVVAFLIGIMANGIWGSKGIVAIILIGSVAFMYFFWKEKNEE